MSKVFFVRYTLLKQSAPRFPRLGENPDNSGAFQKGIPDEKDRPGKHQNSPNHHTQPATPNLVPSNPPGYFFSPPPEITPKFHPKACDLLRNSRIYAQYDSTSVADNDPHTNPGQSE